RKQTFRKNLEKSGSVKNRGLEIQINSRKKEECFSIVLVRKRKPSQIIDLQGFAYFSSNP
ncbi:MAG: hypothetical protein AB8F74_22885, partial [Saprospiraceae bacterium]